MRNASPQPPKRAASAAPRPAFASKKNIAIACGSFAVLAVVAALFAVYALKIDFSVLTRLAQTNALTGREWYLVGLIAMCLYQWVWYCANVILSAKPLGLKCKFADVLVMGLVCTLMISITPFGILAEPYKIY